MSTLNLPPQWMLLRGIPLWQPTLCVLVVIIYLTLTPAPLENDIQWWEGTDKIVHFLMFGGLTGTVLLDRLRAGRPCTLRSAWGVAICCILLSIVIETLQAILPINRSGNDPFDILANALGCITAIPIARSLGIIKKY